MSAQWLAWSAVACWAAACLAATGVRTLAAFAPHELRELGRRRNRPRRLAEILRRRAAVATCVESVQWLAAAAYVVLAWTALSVQAAAGGAQADAGAAATGGWPAPLPLVGAAVGLLAGVLWIPAGVARLWSSAFLFHTWPLWRIVAVVLTPLAWASSVVEGLLRRLSGREVEEPDEESFEDDIRTFVSQGEREGLLEEDAREMIEGVIDLGEADVCEIMTPRTDMISMADTLSWGEALDFVVHVEHTRIPVFSKNRDDIIGILHTKDLLPLLARCEGTPREPWTSLLRAPFFVPETKPIDTLLEDFQRTRNHIAIVLDEYGGVSGLVTLEDVLEEIVGEIVDEYDHEQVEWIHPLGEGTCEVIGRAHLDELNERMGYDLPEEEEFDTIAGFVFHEMGRVPVAGEELVWRDVRITVLDASPRRIDRVRIERIDPNGLPSDTARDQGVAAADSPAPPVAPATAEEQKR